MSDEELEEVRLVNPNLTDPDLSASSIKKFLKLAADNGLTVIQNATVIHVGDTFYAADSKKQDGARKGDLKKAGGNVECVFITITNGSDFGASAAWEGGQFKSCFIGGSRSGHYPEKMYTQITKTMEEITRCLTQ